MGIAEDQQRYANQAHGLSEGEAYGYASIGGGGGGGSAYWTGGAGGAGGAGTVIEFPSLRQSTICRDSSWQLDFKHRMDDFADWTNQMAREQSEFATRLLLFIAVAVETVFLLAWMGI